MRVLVWSPILADEPSLGHFLVRANLTLVEADGAEDLIERVGQDLPQIVILDEDMPGGGFESVRRLRLQPGGAAAAVLMRTRRTARAPLDGVICILKGDGPQALSAVLTRLLLVPIRATFRAHAIVEVPRKVSGQRCFEAQVIDASVSGLKVKLAASLRTGDLVSVGLVLLPGEPMILAACRVVRFAGEERGQRLYGLEFKDLLTRDREALQACIDRVVERAMAPQQPSAAPSV